MKSQSFLLYGILIGLTLGALFGVFWIGGVGDEIATAVSSQHPDWTEEQVSEEVGKQVLARHDYRIVQTIGELFINALRMLVIPLVFFSMVVGIANLGDIRKVGRTGRTTLIYYMLTTGMAVLLGIFLVDLIQPGVGTDVSQMDQEAGERAAAKQFSFYQVILGMVHPNIVQAMAETQILPIILFSLAFGAILTTLGDKGKLVLDVAEGCNEAILKFVQLVVLLAPFGVFGLVGSKIGAEVIKGNLGEEITRLGLYMMTVILGLGLHGFVVLPLILFLVTHRNPLTFLRHGSEALLTAFSTASSSATLPVTMKCLEQNAKVSPRYVGFVTPLGATINMDGTALYEAVAVIYIAQAIGEPLTGTAQVIVFLTATLAAIGAAGIPEAGLVTMVMVFEAVGIDPVNIGLILSIDWFLDRCRTTINVWGDMIGASVVEQLDGPPPDATAPSP